MQVNKVAQYLQQHLNGEVLSTPEALRHFSTDDSIFTITPQLVVYPRSENDVRKAARFTWQLAEKGRIVPITPRGNGTDHTGAAIGSGIVMVMPAHMNKVIELDPKTGVVTAEAGISLDKLQQVLHTHGRFLPIISEVNAQGTLGGAVANNDTGRASYKYGPTQEFVRSLRVVLANGELIQTARIGKRELNKKLGLASFEGEIYRSLDKIIEESHGLTSAMSGVTNNSPSGYDIADVKQKDGSFDLTPLFVGGQGSLGIITEITLDTLPYNPVSSLIVAEFTDRSQAWSAVTEINALKEGPETLDFIDKTLIAKIQEINPNVLKPLDGNIPATLLFMEIDNDNARARKKLLKKIEKILKNSQAEYIEVKENDREQWYRLRDGASIYLTHSKDGKKPVPIMDDAMIPLPRMNEFFTELEALMSTAAIDMFAVWGQAGNGMIHVSPMLDLSAVGDRQKIFKLMDAYYSYVCGIGGSTAGEYAEGRLRGMMSNKAFRPEAMELFKKIKHAFDPAMTLNPGIKTDTSVEYLRSCVRETYILSHQLTHLPRG